MIRLFDLLLALTGLILLFPLYIIISLIIYLESGGKVFFFQKRVGLNGVEFTLYKFRTMITTNSKSLNLTVRNDPRITRTGRLLRKYKLDELPQLLNVLKGDMSIVGPRPELPEYVKYYTKEQKKILSIKPGITDYASIEFSREEDLLAEESDPIKFYIERIMPQKIRLNTLFLNNRDLGSYFKIIFRTLLIYFN